MNRCVLLHCTGNYSLTVEPLQGKPKPCGAHLINRPVRLLCRLGMPLLRDVAVKTITACPDLRLECLNRTQARDALQNYRAFVKVQKRIYGLGAA